MSGQQRTRRPILAYWVPLVTTLSLATIGIVTWALHTHSSDQEDYDSDSLSSSEGRGKKEETKHGSGSSGRPFGAAGSGTGGAPSDSEGRFDPYHNHHRDYPHQDQQHRPIVLVDEEHDLPDDHPARTSTPFQTVRDVGSAFGRALGVVAEETKEWLSELTAREGRLDDDDEQGPRLAAATAAAAEQPGFSYGSPSLVTQKSNLTEADKVVVVVADTEHNFLAEIPHTNHGIRLVILLHSPNGGHQPPHQTHHEDVPSSSSSFSAISYPTTPATGHSVPASASRSRSGSHLGRHMAASSVSDFSAYERLRDMALFLATDETCVIQFSTPGGWVSVVRHLRPAVVYVSAKMALELNSVGAREESRARQVLPWVTSEVVVKKVGETVFPDFSPDDRRLALIDEDCVMADWASRVQSI